MTTFIPLIFFHPANESLSNLLYFIIRDLKLQANVEEPYKLNEMLEVFNVSKTASEKDRSNV